MKFNWKNRPKCSLCACCKRREEWDKAFEAELRAIEKVDTEDVTMINADSEVYIKIKEILAE